MKVCHTLISFFFLSLQDGNTGFINAQNLVRTVSEGGNITVACSFSFSGSRKIFCKRECEGKDILIETEEDRAQSGRYSIEYKEGFFLASNTLLYVSITKLTKSDSGRYTCWLKRSLFPDSTEDFELRVEDALTNLTTTPTSAADPGPLLYVRLTVVVIVIVLSAAALIFCRKRASEPKEPPVDASVTEANRVYEEIGEEDRQSRSPPAEISTVYTYAKYSKPRCHDNRFATGASSQKNTEDYRVKSPTLRWISPTVQLPRSTAPPVVMKIDP